MGRFLVFAMMFFCVIAHGQDRSGYELLWRIEGNGLTKPSYIFGTMHVKSAKAFEFSDSVMTAIERSDVFALEVHPDSIMANMFSKIFSDTFDVIERLLDESEYQEYESRFKQANGYDLEQVKVKNPISLRNFMRPSVAKDDDKSTFVDAYLFGMARNMDKPISGLEEVETQMKLFLDMPEVEQKKLLLDGVKEFDTLLYESYYDGFLDAYYQGDLDEMEKWLGTYNLDGPVNVGRNKVMLASMEEIMQHQSVFAAVGAAHLMGENGLIALFRKKGYDVKAVKATFTGVADTYKADVLAHSWPTYKNSEVGIAVDMPGQPIGINLTLPMKMVMYPDLLTGSFFCLLSMDLRGGASEFDEDEMMDQMIKNYETSDSTMRMEVLSKKKIQAHGHSGMEMLVKTKRTGLCIRMQVWVVNGMFHMVYAGGTGDQFKQPYLERFFNSVEFSDLASKPATTKKEDWIQFRDTLGAYVVDVPVEPKMVTRETGIEGDDEMHTIDIILQVAIDQKSLMNYIVAYNDLPSGYYIDNKQRIFEELIQQMLTSTTEGLVSGPDTIYLDGFEGREIALRLSDTYYTKCQFFVRGNRVYKLLQQRLLGGSEGMENTSFFESFAFADYIKPKMEVYLPDDASFTALTFSKIKEERDSSTFHGFYEESEVTVNTTCPTSGGVYIFSYANLKEYFRITDLDSFYQEYEDYFINWNDTVLSNEIVEISGKTKGKDLLLENKYTHDQRRYRFWIEGGRIFNLSAYATPKELTGPIANRFFDGYKNTSSNNDFDLFESKIDKLSAGWSSNDTVVFNQAKGALSYYCFKKDELPALHEALAASYSDEKEDDDIKNELVACIGVLKDVSSLEPLRNAYLKEGASDLLKSTILTELIDMNEDWATEAFIKLFIEYPPTQPFSTWRLISPFRDSLVLAAQNFDALTKLQDQEVYRRHIVELATKMSASDDEAYQKLASQNFETIVRYAYPDLDSLEARTKREKRDYFYSIEVSSYLELLGHSKEMEFADRYTQAVLAMVPDDNYIYRQALMARILCHLEYNKKAVKKAMVSPYTRYGLLTAFHRAERLEEVPKKYLKPKSLATLAMWEYLSYEEEYPEDIKIVGEVRDGDSIVYVCSIHFDYEGAEDFIGLAGAFHEDSKTIRIEGLRAYCGWEAINEDWYEQARDLLSDYREYGY